MKMIIKKFQRFVPTLLILFLLGTQTAVPATALACGTATGSAGQVLSGVTNVGGNCDGSAITSTIATAVNILSLIIGFAAVIMILVSGYRYITSGGESGKVSGAKSTLIYALIGLAIAALAQVLVHFVLYQATQAGG
jgi:hypothetical protein